MGEEVSEQLDYIPARLRVRRHVRLKYGCKHCGLTLRIADKPEQPIAKGLATSGLLAHILVSKYQDHLPLHRQEQIFARQGIDLVRSTLGDWIAECAKLCAPLITALQRELLNKKRIHTDDTPVPVQLKSNPGKTHQGRLWVYLGCTEQSPTVVLYDYTPSRSQTGPLEILKHYQGFLQADAYSGYDKLFVSGKIIEAGCWAHVRRKFYEIAVSTHSEIANTALAYIQQLYEREAKLKDLSSEQRQVARQTQAKPVRRQENINLIPVREKVVGLLQLGIGCLRRNNYR